MIAASRPEGAKLEWLERLKELYANATKGPWRSSYSGSDPAIRANGPCGTPHHDGCVIVVTSDHHEPGRARIDIDLIAALYEAAPILEAQLQTLRGEHERLAEHARQGWAAMHVAEGTAAEAILEREQYREALTSIAMNTCCGLCQEAALVARAALAPRRG